MKNYLYLKEISVLCLLFCFMFDMFEAASARARDNICRSFIFANI